MADQWYVARNQQNSGPYLPAQLKQLASSGQLLPTDQVWKEGMKSWVPASKVTGLFTTVAPPESPIPPPPVAQPTVNSANPQPTAPASSPPTFLEQAKAGATGLASKSKIAGELAVKQAERAKIEKLTLPAAYLALGKDGYESGRFRSEFPQQFAQADELSARLQALRASSKSIAQQTGFVEKAKAAASKVAEAAQEKNLSIQLNSVLRQLGEMAFEKQGTAAGPEPLIQPIVASKSHRQEIEVQIASLSDQIGGTGVVGSGGQLKENPILIACSMIFCFPAGLFLVWANSAWTTARKLVWTGGFTLFVLALALIGAMSNTGIGSKVVTAQDLASAFLKNEGSADRRYKNRVVEVSGTVLSSGEYTFNDDQGQAIKGTFYKLVGLPGQMGLKCNQAPGTKALADVASLIVVRGEVRGVESTYDNRKYVWLSNCEIISVSEGRVEEASAVNVNAAYEDGFGTGQYAVTTYKNTNAANKRFIRDQIIDNLRSQENERDNLIRQFGKNHPAAQRYIELCKGQRAALEKGGVLP